MSASEHLDGKDRQRQHHLLRQYYLGGLYVGWDLAGWPSSVSVLYLSEILNKSTLFLHLIPSSPLFRVLCLSPCQIMFRPSVL